MPTRLLVGYSLLVVLVAGIGFALWWAVHNSPANVRRRERRERRARHRAGEVAHEAREDEKARPDG